MTREEVNKIRQEEMRDMIRDMVGDYTNMKNLDKNLEGAMYEIATLDKLIGYEQTVPAAKKIWIPKWLEHKNKSFITAAYLYYNWRVWATYKQNEEMARAYQSVCDAIDDKIFDEWHNTEELNYFIRETD